jgi:hypothetical protein
MSLTEKLRNPFVQQYAVEILFPLIGFFFFDWSLVVIAVFYLMDQIGSETAFFRRLVRVSVAKNAPYIRVFTWSLAAFLALFVVQGIFLLLVGFDLMQSAIPATDEIIKFMKEEGWFLFPLVIFMYHFKDQFMFYMPRRYLQYKPMKMQLYRLVSNLVILVLVVGGISVLKLVELPGAVVLILFLVLKVVFDFTIAKWVDRKSKL